jgi:protein TonB
MAASAGRAGLPTTRLQRRQRARAGWWVGALVAVTANLAIVAVLVRISNLRHEAPPAPSLVQRITAVEPPPPDEPEPLPEPSEEPAEAPAQLTMELPALDLAAPSLDAPFVLPSLPISDQPLELPSYLPAFSAVASAPSPGVAAPSAIANAPIAFDEAPVLISGFDLQRFYPRQARARRVQGETMLRFDISAEGVVTRVTVLSSTPPGVFEQAAERLGRSLRFTPAKRAGRPVPSVFTQPVVWNLER